MRIWPFNRRQQPAPVDRTGAATSYPNRSGALGAAAGEQDARARDGGRYRWCAGDTEIIPRTTLGEQWRGNGGALRHG